MSTDSVEIVPDEQVTRLTAIVESSDSAIIGMALDGTTDALTTQRALKELKVPNEMIRMTDREEALEYLQELKLSIFIRHCPCFFTPLNPKASRGFFCLSFFAL